MPRPPKVSPAEHYAKASDVMFFLANVEEPVAGRQLATVTGRRSPSRPGRCEHPQSQRRPEATETCPSCGNQFVADSSVCRRCAQKRQRGLLQQPLATMQQHQQAPGLSSPTKVSQHAQQSPDHQFQQSKHNLEQSRHPEASRLQECLLKPLQHMSGQQEPQVRLVQYQSASQLPVQFSSQPQPENLAAAENSYRLPLRRPGATAQNMPAHAVSQHMPYMLGPCLHQADESPLRGQCSPSSPLQSLQQTANSSVVRQRSAPSPPLHQQADVSPVTRHADQSAVIRQRSSPSPMPLTPRDPNLGFSSPKSPQAECYSYSSPSRSNSLFSPPARTKTSPDRQHVYLSHTQSAPHRKPDLATSAPMSNVGSRAKPSRLQQRLVVQPPQEFAGLIGSGPCDHTTSDLRTWSNEGQLPLATSTSVKILLEPSIPCLTSFSAHDSELAPLKTSCRDDPIPPAADAHARRLASTPLPSPGSRAREVMTTFNVCRSICSNAHPVCTPAAELVTKDADNSLDAANLPREESLFAPDVRGISVSAVEMAESFAHATQFDANDSHVHKDVLESVSTATSPDEHGLNGDAQQIKYSSQGAGQRDSCVDQEILLPSVDAQKLVDEVSSHSLHEQQQSTLPNDEDAGVVQAELRSLSETIRVQDASTEIVNHCGDDLVHSRIFTLRRDSCIDQEIIHPSIDAEKLVDEVSSHSLHEQQQQQLTPPNDEDAGVVQPELRSVSETIRVQDASAEVVNHCGDGLVRSRNFTFENAPVASTDTTGSDAEKRGSNSLDSCTDDETWKQLRSQLQSLHQSVHEIANKQCFLADVEVEDNPASQSKKFLDANLSFQQEVRVEAQGLPVAWPALPNRRRNDPKLTCQQEKHVESQAELQVGCKASVPGSKAAAQLLEVCVSEQAIASGKNIENFAPQPLKASRDPGVCQRQKFNCTPSEMIGETGSGEKLASPSDDCPGAPVYPSARELAPSVPFGNHSLERTDAMARLRRALHSKSRPGSSRSRSSSLSGTSRSSSRLQPSQAKAFPTEQKNRSGLSSKTKASDPQSAMAQLWLPQPR